MTRDFKDRSFALASDWLVSDVANFFGLSENQVATLLPPESNGHVNRFQFEKRMVSAQQISLDWLALKFGLPTLALEKAMRSSPLKKVANFPLDHYADQGHYLLPLRFAEAWVKELLPPHKTWNSLDCRARDLADVLSCQPRICAVSTYFHESPPAVASCRCIVSWDDVSRAHQEYLENHKPPSLEPDHIGWHVLDKVPCWQDDLLRHDIGNLDEYRKMLGEPSPAA